MHTLEITGVNGQRKHSEIWLVYGLNGTLKRRGFNGRTVIDEVYVRLSRRRNYGPLDVAKAARMYSPYITELNAGSYTQIASGRGVRGGS
jgi:hypothetical protein